MRVIAFRDNFGYKIKFYFKIQTNAGDKMAYSVFNKDNLPKQHYNVRILKFQSQKVLMNGRLKDRTELTAEEHRVVQAQEEIESRKNELNTNLKYTN